MSGKPFFFHCTEYRMPCIKGKTEPLSRWERQKGRSARQRWENARPFYFRFFFYCDFDDDLLYFNNNWNDDPDREKWDCAHDDTKNINCDRIRCRYNMGCTLTLMSSTMTANATTATDTTKKDENISTMCIKSIELHACLPETIRSFFRTNFRLYYTQTRAADTSTLSSVERVRSIHTPSSVILDSRNFPIFLLFIPAYGWGWGDKIKWIKNWKNKMES